MLGRSSKALQWGRCTVRLKMWLIGISYSRSIGRLPHSRQLVLERLRVEPFAGDRVMWCSNQRPLPGIGRGSTSLSVYTYVAIDACGFHSMPGHDST